MKQQFANMCITVDADCAPLAFALKILAQNIQTVDYTQNSSFSFACVEGLEAQSYRVTKQGENDFAIAYTYENGLMYAVLDVADAVLCEKTVSDFHTGVIAPSVKNRGIKFNIPLDARSPSYSDEADSAQKNIENMWDMSFWTAFIDQLASYKYNAISLWSLAPFPSLVYVEEYPEVSLQDVKRTTRPIVSTTEADGMCNPEVLGSLVTVKKMTIHEKITFWRAVMQYAKERCIDFYLFTWNLFTYGTEGNPYGIEEHQNCAATTDYYEKAVCAMVKTYPLLAGIGVTCGEWMTHTPKDDIAWVRKTYGKGIENALLDCPERNFRFIHRLQYANIELILQAYSDFTPQFEVSFKYSQAHMHGAVKPVFSDDMMQALPDTVKMWLTVRNDDYYMFRWGDPDFAKAYISNMPEREKLSGFFMGPDGYTWGREYISKDLEVRGTNVSEKMWYSFYIWGKVAFDPTVDTAHFEKRLATSFGQEVAPTLFEAWKLASGLFGDFHQTHWRDFDFQWYPEACCHFMEPERALWFADINEFMTCVSEPGAGRLSVSDYCAAVLSGSPLTGESPLVAAKRIQDNARKSMALVKTLEGAAVNKEFARTIIDIKGLNLIGLYYGLKVEAAVLLTLARAQGDAAKKEQAIALLTECLALWKEYSALVSEHYLPQHLTRLKHVIDVSRFDDLAACDILLAQE
ncbi:MAG: hypothetical protein R3Y06_06495 [Faecalibacterium sp.]